MPKPQCLIVDDIPDMLELLVRTLEPMGIDCFKAQTYSQALEYLQTNSFDLCLTDMKLEKDDGIDLVAHIVQNYPQTPAAVITAHGDVETAVRALKVGAFDYVRKPVNVLDLRNLVNSALQLPKPNEATIVNSAQDSLEQLIGNSRAMQELRAKIQKVARGQAPIHIRGESGTGKEIVANCIHCLSSSAKKPFIAVNCGAIPNELMESEFFGHKKGAFTGAIANKDGLFQAAQGGTLFLDEIADLPIPLQIKLLRAIQEKQIRPVGATKEISVDVRIVSATHGDLASLVDQGKFRRDLFFRINVIELYIPPLRDRKEDLPDLVEKILADISVKNYCPIPRLSPTAIIALETYPFPGNIRELENILERATMLCDNNCIEAKNLQLTNNSTQFANDNQLISQFQAVATEEDLPFTNNSIQFANDNQSATQLYPLLEAVEKTAILNALEKTDWNQPKAAESLGIGVGALRYRIQKFFKHK